jgi:hypothetical protein
LAQESSFEMTKTQFYGVTSLILVGIAIVLAAVAIFQASLWLGIGYLLLCAVASAVVIYAYCAKCPSKAQCAHVLPGKAALAIQRKPGPYSTAETFSLVTALLLLLGLPQLVLWKNPVLLLAFWVLCGIAVTQVRSVVCVACRNVYCPLNAAKRGVQA